MNPPPDPSERLHELTSRLLDGTASARDIAEVSDLLQTNEPLREDFALLCELDGMLAGEPSIQAALSKDFLPENVVSLAEGNSVAGDCVVGQTNATGTSPLDRPILALLGVAAAVAVGLFALISLSDPDESPVASAVTTEAEAKAEGFPEAKTSRPGPIKDTKPEEQYEKAVLASLGSGSQQRPPTNFVSEPSLADEEISYNRDIRPILSDNCFSCHGPDEHGRKADLRLDTFEGATDPALATIVPGDPGASELVARILSDDSDDIMPPPESHKKLTAAQIDLLTRWVSEGAVYEEHWAFLPVENAAPSGLEGSPIDYFVDQRLEKLGLARSPEAEARTLIRRVALDLTGLPPTPEEVESFVADPSEERYAALVDELLSRPTFGEHRARYWLDAARYGDTHGLHLDNYREIWPYRDWVIDAFNRNMPFDQFTIEQIAGDLLPDATQSQQIATGFNRCNVTTSEGGAIEEEFLVRYAVDRVATTATVWMGLTAGCAQCHDHKFDPLTMNDFYGLFAYFNNTTQPGMDGNAKDSPPVIPVYESPEQEAVVKKLEAEVAAAKKTSAASLAEFDPNGLTFEDIAPKIFDHGRQETPSNLGEIGAFGIDDTFSVSFRYSLPAEESRIVLVSRTDPENNDRGWRVVWEDQGMVVELIDSFPGKMLKRGLTRRFRPGASGHFGFTYDGSGTSEGIRLFLNGDPQGSRFVNQWFDTLENDFSATGAELLVGGDTGMGKFKNPTVIEFHLADRRFTDEQMKALGELYTVRGIAKKKPEERSEKEQESWKRFAAVFAEGTYRDKLAAQAEAETKLSQVRSLIPSTLVMSEKPEPAMAHFLARGEYDQKGEEVPPALPAFLPELGDSFPPNRLGLARWLVHPDHPLTARVTANRVWQELFGVGLVKTSEDFGTQGENPSHPMLLDWLAATLVDSGWDVKLLYRTIVLSETYRQSSRIPEGMARRDPENRLLARGPRFRLDAEVIRDQALAASGLLDATVGGPSVRPYQPAGIWEAVGYTNSNTQTFYQDYGRSPEHRRSVYTYWKRTAHPPNLAIFDAPNRESCVIRRERTNTPLQALVLMNDPQYVRAARHLAARVLAESTDRDERLDRMAALLRGKPLEDAERSIVVNSLDQFQNIYGSDPAAAAALLSDEANEEFSLHEDDPGVVTEIAAWTMVANQLLNLDEVINKN